MHLAVALRLHAVEQGFGVYFVPVQDFFEDLRRAQAEHRLDRRMRVYLAPRLLIIDEFGVRSYDRLAATALFSLISARYERSSVVLTSTKGFGEWGEVLGDAVIATAILDRLLHHSHVLNIRGESYRLREKKQAGLFGVSSVPPPTVSEDAADVNRQGRVYSEPAKVGQRYAGADTGA
jgi:DNA replication protein DnaC